MPAAQDDDLNASAATPGASQGVRRSLVWTVSAGVVGFVAGAVFWHMVGFWSLVSDAMLDRAHAPSVAAPRGVVLPPEALTATPTAAPAPAAVRAASPPPPPAHTAPARVPTTAELLADLLQCSEARKTRDPDAGSSVKACPPMRERLRAAATSTRADRQLSASEAADRLANGWATGVSRIETGSIRMGSR